MCKLRDTDGSRLLHLSFINITEYDPGVILDTNLILLKILHF